MMRKKAKGNRGMQRRGGQRNERGEVHIKVVQGIVYSNSSCFHLSFLVHQGATKGLGSQGIISPKHCRASAKQPAVMRQRAHSRWRGEVYFRYGGFWHRLLPACTDSSQTVKMVRVRFCTYV